MLSYCMRVVILCYHGGSLDSSEVLIAYLILFIEAFGQSLYLEAIDAADFDAAE